MKNFPIDCTRLGSVAVLSVAPALDQDKNPKLNASGTPVFRFECLVRPDQTGDFQPKAELVQVAVPVAGKAPAVEPMTRIEFEGLVARAWEMNGRSGIALSATSYLTDGVA